MHDTRGDAPGFNRVAPLGHEESIRDDHQNMRGIIFWKKRGEHEEFEGSLSNVLCSLCPLWLYF